MVPEFTGFNRVISSFARINEMDADMLQKRFKNAENKTRYLPMSPASIRTA